MKRLLIFVAIVFACFIIYAVVGSLMTGNTPDKKQGIGATNSADSTQVVADDTLRR
ncbi:MAG: hypothetical protein LH606_17320 [Cytophagaceae bacterium]|nr:hypothetical protein [Cytophagaceae bacterium]